MAKVKLTNGRITAFECPEGKSQSFLWCDEVPGLGVRATPGSTRKRYIFESKVMGKTMRVTIGEVSVWNINAAKVEARRLQTVIDNGDDPRQVKVEIAAQKQAALLAKKSEAAALAAQELRESVTVETAWQEYIADRKPFWGDRHYDDHVKLIQSGGEQRKRSHKLTEPGPLSSLSTVRLIELTPERIIEWAKDEGKIRAGRARLAHRLLKAFLSWCMEHQNYRAIVTGNPAKNKTTREQLGKPTANNDVLQREQLPAWFTATKQISNPVISAYMQILLLTGARPNELSALRWEDIDFQWNSMTIGDKMEGLRVTPLTPYIKQLLNALPRRNKFAFSSMTSESGHLEDPHDAHYRICAHAGLTLTLYGLRGSFATLSEWIEMPAGIAAQIQGHKPSGVREKHYIRRPLDLLRMWHVKIEAWILEQAGIELKPERVGLHAVA